MQLHVTWIWSGHDDPLALANLDKIDLVCPPNIDHEATDVGSTSRCCLLWYSRQVCSLFGSLESSNVRFGLHALSDVSSFQFRGHHPLHQYNHVTSLVHHDTCYTRACKSL